MGMAASLRQRAKTVGFVTQGISSPCTVQRGPIMLRIDLRLSIGIHDGLFRRLAVHLRTPRLVRRPTPRRQIGNRALVSRNVLCALPGMRRSGR